jgi:hypothetical protein
LTRQTSGNDEDGRFHDHAARGGQGLPDAGKPRHGQVRGGPAAAPAVGHGHPLLAVIYAFVIIPLLDMWTGDDTSAAPSDPTRLSDDTKAHFRDLLKYYVLGGY